MSSRLFSSPLRLSTRLTARPYRVALARRMMSSDSHASHSSDAPWMIGSALVFGPLFLYLVSPSARKDHHAAGDHGHTKSHRDHEDKHAQLAQSPGKEDAVPVADDEGTQVSSQEVKESIERALEVDSPKDAQEHEEAIAKETSSAAETQPEAEPVTDTTTVAQSEPNPAPVTPVEDSDVAAAQATAVDNLRTPTTESTPEATAESKA